jgi:hypothetical protein
MKKYLLIIFLLLALIISGCQPSQTTTTGPFKGGIDGLSINFVNLAPISQFSQNDSVKVKVLLKNKGETQVTTGNAKSRMFGVNLDVFSLTPEYRSNLGPLIEIGPNQDGGEQEIELGTIKYKGQIINSQDFTLRSRLCYVYQTKSAANVCIKSALSQEAGESTCDINGEKVTKGSVSGAPIQITSIKEQTRGSDQIRFDVTIENKGKGEVYPINSICKDLDDEVKRVESKNKINVKVIEPQGVICSFSSGEPSSEGIITLDSTNKKVLSCWKSVQDTQVESLRLILDYVYRDQAQKQITIFETRR